MVAEDLEDKPVDLVEQASDHWRMWQRFLSLVFGTAAVIFVFLALMWIFLV